MESLGWLASFIVGWLASDFAKAFAEKRKAKAQKGK